MSSFPPPNVYFNGIIYDSDYFVSSSSVSGLTVSQANAKYLQKTVSDTATALEKFNAGIATTTLTASGASTLNGTTKVLGSQLIVRDNDGAPTANTTIGCTPNAPAFSMNSLNTGLTLSTDTTSNIELQGTGKT